MTGLAFDLGVADGLQLTGKSVSRLDDFELPLNRPEIIHSLVPLTPENFRPGCLVYHAEADHRVHRRWTEFLLREHTWYTADGLSSSGKFVELEEFPWTASTDYSPPNNTCRSVFEISSFQISAVATDSVS